MKIRGSAIILSTSLILTLMESAFKTWQKYWQDNLSLKRILRLLAIAQGKAWRVEIKVFMMTINLEKLS
jgi:hypothetical protein